ncbi:hypothetical protein BDF19DRAFT_193326 [Syncephalis fuscata]|nr:hypothetical protein BDF19DRAFT_193326 [Syncephalis fuscata]
MAPPTVFSYQERSKPVHKRSCCCCTCLICCIVLLIILVGIALTLFFLWPRIPDVQYLGIRTVNAPSITDSSFSGKYNATIQINNRNYIGWTINKRDMYNLTIPIDINYKGDKNDPEVARLVAICAPPRTSLPAKIEAKLWIKGIDWAYKPTISKDITITCPQ